MGLADGQRQHFDGAAFGRLGNDLQMSNVGVPGGLNAAKPCRLRGQQMPCAQLPMLDCPDARAWI